MLIHPLPAVAEVEYFLRDLTYPLKRTESSRSLASPVSLTFAAGIPSSTTVRRVDLQIPLISPHSGHFRGGRFRAGHVSGRGLLGRFRTKRPGSASIGLHRSRELCRIIPCTEPDIFYWGWVDWAGSR